ncbi:MAG: haloacid dehalogenase type II [Sneathiellaceae bacterium]
MTRTIPSALLFDVFGTVVDWHGTVAREAALLLRPKGIALDWEGFAKAWRKEYAPSFMPIVRGERSYADLDVLHRENLLRVLAAEGLPPQDDALVDELVRIWHRLDPWPDAVGGLRRLRGRFPLCTVSNGHAALMAAMARHAGLDWDLILGSEPAQQYKPHPRVYLTAANWLRLEPGACMMVATHENDLKAAAECGLRTAYVCRPHEFGRRDGDGFDDMPSGSYDVVARDFHDLAAQLGC